MVCIYYLTVLLILNLRFESTVKTKGYQTTYEVSATDIQFESTVKTKGYQTPKLFIVQVTSLRVLLKHKVIKPG